MVKIIYGLENILKIMMLPLLVFYVMICLATRLHCLIFHDPHFFWAVKVSKNSTTELAYFNEGRGIYYYYFLQMSVMTLLEANKLFKRSNTMACLQCAQAQRQITEPQGYFSYNPSESIHFPMCFFIQIHNGKKKSYFLSSH